MRLNVNTDAKKFFRQLLELLSGIPPLDGLRKRELDLLSIYMYYNYKYRGLEEKVRWRILNSASTKKEMQEEIDMNADVFNNNLSLVRKTKVLGKDGSLVSFLQIYPDEIFNIEFVFKIEG
jgi:hypothetical protein